MKFSINRAVKTLAFNFSLEIFSFEIFAKDVVFVLIL